MKKKTVSTQAARSTFVGRLVGSFPCGRKSFADGNVIRRFRGMLAMSIFVDDILIIASIRPTSQQDRDKHQTQDCVGINVPFIALLGLPAEDRRLSRALRGPGCSSELYPLIVNHGKTRSSAQRWLITPRSRPARVWTGEGQIVGLDSEKFLLVPWGETWSETFTSLVIVWSGDRKSSEPSTLRSHLRSNVNVAKSATAF